MSSPMITADPSTTYEVKEAAVIIAALAFVIAVGGVALCAIVICGWRGAQKVVVDWVHGQAQFVCR